MCLIRPQSRALLDSSIFATFKCVLYRNDTDEDDWPNMKANFLRESLKRTQQEDAFFVINLAPASQFHEMKNLFFEFIFIDFYGGQELTLRKNFSRGISFLVKVPNRSLILLFRLRPVRLSVNASCEWERREFSHGCWASRDYSTLIKLERLAYEQFHGKQDWLGIFFSRTAFNIALRSGTCQLVCWWLNWNCPFQIFAFNQTMKIIRRQT